MYRLIKSWFFLAILFFLSLILTVIICLFPIIVEPAGGQASKIYSLPTFIQYETDYSLSWGFNNDELVAESLNSNSGNIGYSVLAVPNRVIKFLIELVEIAKNFIIKSFKNIFSLIYKFINVLLFIIIILPLYYIYRLLRWLKSWTESKVLKLPLTIYQILRGANECHIYTGDVSIPIKVYEGNSHGLSIEIQHSSVLKSVNSENFNPIQSENNLVFVHTLEGNNTRELNQCLEVLLLAGSGVLVAGERIQSHSLDSHKIIYFWICSFPASSNQEINLEFKFITLSNLEQGYDQGKIEPIDTRRVPQIIQVVKLWRLKKEHLELIILLLKIFLILWLIIIFSVRNQFPELALWLKNFVLWLKNLDFLFK